MYFPWKFVTIVLLTAAVGSCLQSAEIGISRSEDLKANGDAEVGKVESNFVYDDQEVASKAELTREKRQTSGDQSSVSLWEWLTGRDKPTPCVMASVGGVIGGGALTGAFVGAGIGSIFTGPGALIGAVVGGIAGIFGGISVGHRAGAAACGSGCDLDQNSFQCYSNK